MMRVFFAIIFLLAIAPSSVAKSSTREVHNVLNYGAVGGGKHDDTKAFMTAWTAACKSPSPSSFMYVPEGETFLINPIYFKGPCNSASITVEINGEIIAPDEPSHWKFQQNNKRWIHFTNVDGLSLIGQGRIHGRGTKWWNLAKKAPTALEISSSKNVHLEGLTFKDNPRMHIVLKNIKSANVTGITIEAPEDSKNTDGIHLTGSQHVTISNCTIGTGDDCISMVDGTSNVIINKITCGPGHGISIGSLGKDGSQDTVEDVEVSDVVFVKTKNGARIKTWQGGKGYARNITFERIQTLDSKNPIIINQFYYDYRLESNNKDSAVQISNVAFRHVNGTTRSKNAIILRCSDVVPCRNISLFNINIVSSDGEKEALAECRNVEGIVQGHMVPRVSC